MQPADAPEGGPPAFPDVLEISAEPHGVSARLSLRPDLPCFLGHFDEFPLVPGVVQIAWAVEFAATHLGYSGAISRVERLKFMRYLLPSMAVNLSVHLDSNSAVQFRYTDAQKLCASGRLVYAD